MALTMRFTRETRTRLDVTTTQATEGCVWGVVVGVGGQRGNLRLADTKIPCDLSWNRGGLLVRPGVRLGSCTPQSQHRSPQVPGEQEHWPSYVKVSGKQVHKAVHARVT